MSTARICVVIPAYNEAGKIRPVVEGAVRTRIPVIVVDDGSKDATAAEAEAAGAEVIRHPVNRGKGAAIRTAIGHVIEAGYAAAIFMDADGQHLPEEIPLFVAEHRSSAADLVVGTRMADTSAMPWVRKASNRFSSLLVSLVAGTRVTDSQSGYRLLSTRMLRYLRDRGGRGFDFETEMIIDAARLGMRYREVPITCVYGPQWASHFHPVKDSADFLKVVAVKAVHVVTGRIREDG